MPEEEKKAQECEHDCEDCKENCPSRESAKAPMNKHSDIKRVVAVVSGKGGVGKSLVTGMLAVRLQQMGKSVGILDADITGPSIPKMFGLTEKVKSGRVGIIPAETKSGIEVMSINLILDREDDPVIWRGPVVTSVLQQFWSEVVWGELDCMLVDLPPGTGDAPLTVFQSLPLDGIIIVASPQELVSVIVRKAANMAKQMNIPILGIVENMSYYECPDCHKRHSVFGESHLDEIAEQYGISNVAKIPIEPDIAKLCDKGKMEDVKGEWLNEMANMLAKPKK